MYREIRACTGNLDALDQNVRAALLAGGTQDISRYTDTAMAIADQMLARLKGAMGSRTSGEAGADATLVQAAVDALNTAWQSCEKVGLSEDADGMHASLLDVKTNVDYARAYLRAAIGSLDV